MSTFRNDLYSAVGSDLTSSIYFVGDAEELTIAFDVDSTTSVEVHGSNAQGFRVAFVEDDWSTLTTVVSATVNEILNIEPGFRWIRCVRESSTSLPSAVVAGRNDDGR